MTDHTQLVERMRRANPVADPADPPAGAAGADVVLLAIERRSTIVQTTTPHTQQTPPPPKRWNGLWAAAAAFAAIVIAVGLLALVRGGATDEPVATTQAPTTTEAPPTTEAATTTQAPSTTQAPTTTVAAVESFPGVPELTVGRLDPGSVAAGGVPIPFAFEAPDVSADYDQPLWVVEAGMPGPGIVPGEFVFDPSTPLGSIIFPMTRAQDDAEQVVADLTGELPVTTTAETTVGGQPAIQIDVEAFDGFFPLEFLGTSPSGEPNFGIDGEFTNRFYIVDTQDGTLIIWFEVAPQHVDTLLPQWERIVSTIEFTN